MHPHGVSCNKAALLMEWMLPSSSLAHGSSGGLEELLGAHPTLAIMLLPLITSGLLGAVCDPGTRDGGVSTTMR